jgi:hypothetical protein
MVKLLPIPLGKVARKPKRASMLGWILMNDWLALKTLISLMYGCSHSKGVDRKNLPFLCLLIHMVYDKFMITFIISRST